MSCCHAPPIPEPAEHDLDSVAPVSRRLSDVTAFFRGFRLSTRGAAAYLFVFQCISEPIGVMPPQAIARAEDNLTQHVPINARL